MQALVEMGKEDKFHPFEKHHAVQIIRHHSWHPPFFFLHFGEQPKLEKMEKPKGESLLRSACWKEFGGDGEEPACGPFLMIHTQNIRLRIR